MLAEKMKTSDIFNIKESDLILKRSKSKSNYRADTMHTILGNGDEDSYTKFKPTKKVITVQSSVFNKGNPFQIERSKSRPNIRPKDNMTDCLKSPESVIIKQKKEYATDFRPKWDKNTVKTNQYKNDIQSFSCVGSENLKKETKAEKKQIREKDKKVSSEDFNPKQAKLKSIYPELSKSELKLLIQKTEKPEKSAEIANQNLKVKTQAQLESNIFNSKLKQSKNDKFIDEFAETINKPSKADQQAKSKNEPCVTEPSKLVKVTFPPKNANKDERPKSTRERRLNDLESNLFNYDKTKLTSEQRNNSFRRKPESDHPLFEKFTECQPPNAPSNRSVKQSTDFCEKHYIIQTQTSLRETEIRRLLQKNGLHVSNLNINYDIINNEGLNSVEVKLRSEKLGKNEKMLSQLFNSSKVKEIIKPEKPFLLKPKSDLISGTLNILDTQMSYRYKTRDLETTKALDFGKPANYSKLSS